MIKICKFYMIQICKFFLQKKCKSAVYTQIYIVPTTHHDKSISNPMLHLCSSVPFYEITKQINTIDFSCN